MVIVPFATSERDARPGLLPAVREALEADGIAARYVDVAGDPTAYHQLLAGLWADGQGFTVIEHDVVVRPGAVAQLEGCEDGQWHCGVYLSAVGPLIGGLGFTRFSTDLLRDHPAVFQMIDQLPPDGTPRRYWGRTDTRLKQVLEREGVQPHAHYGVVAYHRRPDYAAHVIIGCPICGAATDYHLYTQMPPPYPCPRCE